MAAPTSGTSRNIKPPQERYKRGRWVTPALLVGSVLISLYFWYLG